MGISFQATCLIKILNRLLILTEFSVSNSPVIVYSAIIQFQAYGFVIVFDCSLILTEVSISPPC